MSGASLARRRVDEYDRRPHSATSCRSSARSVAPTLAPRRSRRSSCRAPPRSSSTARPVPANYLRKAAAIAVAVVGLRRSDCCADAPAELTLSWRLSLTGGWLDDRRDICTRADMNVSISFVQLSTVVAKVCARTVIEAKTGRCTRAHQTPFQPPHLLQGARVAFELVCGQRPLLARATARLQRRCRADSSVLDGAAGPTRRLRGFRDGLS